MLLVELDGVSLLVHQPGRVSATLDAFFFLAFFFLRERISKVGRIVSVGKLHCPENVCILCYFLHRNFGVDVQHREPRVGHGRDIRDHGFFANCRDAEVVADLLLFEGPGFQRISSGALDGFASGSRSVGRLEPLVRDLTAFLLNFKKERNYTVLFQNGYRGRLRNNGKRVLIVLRQSHCHRRQRHEKQDR